ncbi:MAG: hypothetical protein K0U84_15105 [Actinomycetia bacterium]|nr:hypothetical protein [Actinomycetes bacterium]
MPRKNAGGGAVVAGAVVVLGLFGLMAMTGKKSKARSLEEVEEELDEEVLESPSEPIAADIPSPSQPTAASAPQALPQPMQEEPSPIKVDPERDTEPAKTKRREKIAKASEKAAEAIAEAAQTAAEAPPDQMPAVLAQAAQEAAPAVLEAAAEAAPAIQEEVTAILPKVVTEGAPQETPVPPDTLALTEALLAAEKMPNWKRIESAVTQWQKSRGLVEDGKFGPKSAITIANEIGTLPLVRYWPRSAGPNPQAAVEEYRNAIRTIAQSKPTQHAALLNASALREQGQAFGPPHGTRGKLPAA